jgi:hypothetical protein
MLDFFKNKLIPILDAKAEELSRELNKNIIVRYQHHSASPHVKNTSNNFLNNNLHNWMAYWVSTAMFTYNKHQ